MTRHHSTITTLLCLATSFLWFIGASVQAQTRRTAAGVSAAAAMQAAAHNGRYTYIFFCSRDDHQTQTMRNVFHEGVQRLGSSVSAVEVNIKDIREKQTVDHFGVSRAPMPLVLAVAPNGAVTKAFPIRFTHEQLAQGMVSPAMQGCMKALQAQKLVLLAIQNSSTPHSQVAYRGATQFKQDARFANSTEIVTLDPANPAEAGFLRSLKVAPGTKEAVTVVLAPPGKPIATFTGPVTPQQIVQKVTAAQSGCCPGGKCGPGGCCPTK